VVGETQQRGTVLAVMRDAAVPAKALHPSRAGTALDVVPALYAGRTRVAILLAVGAPAGHAAVPPKHVAPGQPRTFAGGSTTGPSEGSSSPGSSGPLALMYALPFLFVLHWSTLLLARERSRRTVFLALPERPG
jgi:hypothetical protein